MFDKFIHQLSVNLNNILHKINLFKPIHKESTLNVIHAACKKGDLRTLKLVLAQENPSFDIPDDTGSTPIFYALEHNHLPVVEFLIKQKVNLDHANIFGRTPIYAAIDSDCPEMIEILLNNKVSMDVADSNGETALHHAIINGKEKSFSFLLTQDNQPIAQKNKFGKTPLILASELSLVHACKILLSRDVNVNVFDNDGWTALMYASSKGNAEIVSLLLSSNADITIKDNDFNQTAYLIACRMGHIHIMQILISYDTNVHDCDYYQRSALHIAVEINNYDMVEFVIGTGVDPLARDKFHLTAKEWAIVNSTAAILRLIINAEEQK
jgi:ankyrin repeat protein